jgi:hypothetical protein
MCCSAVAVAIVIMVVVAVIMIMMMTVIMSVVIVIVVEVPRRERIGELLPALRSHCVLVVGQQARVELRRPQRRVDADADHGQFLATVASADIVRRAIPVGGNFGG